MVATVATTVDPRTRHRAQPVPDNLTRYEPIGAARDLFFATDPEVLVEGPAGTGKSLGCLKKLHRNAVKYPGSRQLILRKTRTSLTQTALVTFEKHVIVPGGRVRFHTTLQAYLYPNGSVIVVGGLDKDSKVMSSEYDTIYVQEATELEESDLEALTTRLRNGVIPHQQIVMDCNPGPPTHWLNRRCDAGKTRRLLSRHEDNPTIWDRDRGQWTPQGIAYIAKLDALSGVRKDRLRFGRWVAAEGQVFADFDRAVHLIRRDELADYGLAEPKRHVGGVDWGWTNPGVLTVAAVGGDGQVGIVHEVYRTRQGREWWIAQAQELQRRYAVDVWVCDPSEPEYIDAFANAGLNAVKAVNDILPGVTAIQDLLAPDNEGRVRWVVVDDANQDPDPALLDESRPTSAVQEIDSYVWAKSPITGRKEKPVDADNHGLDTWRYLAMEATGGAVGFEPVTGALAAHLSELGL